MISTSDIKTGGSTGLPKTLEPGNQQCKINGVALEEFKLKAGGYNLILHMEGPDLGAEFEGFWINKDNESLGRHKGAVGKVRASEWAFVDGTTKGGVAVSRDSDILKFLKGLCTELGIVKWLTVDQDGKHPTIESLINAFNTEQPFKDKYINYCLGAREWKDKNGYIRYDLYIPKFVKNSVPFESLTPVKSSRLLKYNESDHLKKLKVTDVQQFGEEASSSSDFTL